MKYLNLLEFKTTPAYEALSHKIKLALETLALQEERIPIDAIAELQKYDHP